MTISFEGLSSFRGNVTRLFAVIMGVVFLLAKMLIRWITRRLAEIAFDTREAMAWFGVDLSVLSLSIWIAANIPRRSGLSSTESTVAYVFLLCVTLCVSAVYKRYLRISLGARVGLWPRLYLLLHIVVGMFLGILELVSTAARL